MLMFNLRFETMPAASACPEGELSRCARGHARATSSNFVEFPRKRAPPRLRSPHAAPHQRGVAAPLALPWGSVYMQMKDERNFFKITYTEFRELDHIRMRLCVAAHGDASKMPVPSRFLQSPYSSASSRMEPSSIPGTTLAGWIRAPIRFSGLCHCVKSDASGDLKLRIPRCTCLYIGFQRAIGKFLSSER
jgi:hypothetical protein